VLTAIILFLKAVLPTILYGIWILITVLSVFKRAEWGLLLIVALIPQPNVYYQFYIFPMGEDMLDISIFCVLLGIIFQKKGFKKTGSRAIILVYLMLSYVSLWIVSINFSLPMPITTDNAILIKWKDFAQMILLYFLAVNVFKGEKEHKRVIVLISLVLLFIGIRGFRAFVAGDAFSEENRYEGPFWRVGLGSNHYGAFMVHYAAAMLGCFFFEKDNSIKLLFGMTIFFCIYAVLFSYSRGAYAAAMVALTFYGLIHKRSLLILVGVIIFTWNTLLPVTVVERITMTKTESGELESSASERVNLWDSAINIFLENPILGLGYNGFYMKMTAIQAHLTDTHNYYLKVLSEYGLIGVIVLCFLLFKALRQGWKLFQFGNSSFYRGLGLSFLGTTIAVMVTNAFGDRWSYLVLGGYFWILWGLVDQGIITSESEAFALEDNELNKPPDTPLLKGNPVNKSVAV
jgi:O-antigen ligase